jgi:hypothetical protein
LGIQDVDRRHELDVVPLADWTFEVLRV